MKLIDRYFEHPVIWDFAISGGLAFFGAICVTRGFLAVPTVDHLYSTVSDMSTISLTMGGFILTLVTLLISFKSTNKIDKSNVQETDKVFDLFFASPFYFRTIKILNNSIKSLVVVALIGYILKLSLTQTTAFALFLYCIFGIAVIILTVVRCVVILSTIVAMQEERET